VNPEMRFLVMERIGMGIDLDDTIPK